MGAHLINSVAPAITEGEQFTQTWFCGACSGMIAFSEPVITLAYLQLLRNDDWGDTQYRKQRRSLAMIRSGNACAVQR